MDFIWSGGGSETGRQAVSGTVLDMSREGLQASVPYPLPIGMDVTFWLNFSDRERCRLCGKVVWNAELVEHVSEELPYRIGMSLRAPDQVDDREIWDRALVAIGAI